MGKIAFVFSGQGSQYPGMGKALAERYPAAAQVYALCDSLRPGTSRQCFQGTEEELRDVVRFACTSAGISTTRSGGISSVPSYQEVLERMG